MFIGNILSSWLLRSASSSATLHSDNDEDNNIASSQSNDTDLRSRVHNHLAKAISLCSKGDDDYTPSNFRSNPSSTLLSRAMALRSGSAAAVEPHATSQNNDDNSPSATDIVFNPNETSDNTLLYRAPDHDTFLIPEGSRTVFDRPAIEEGMAQAPEAEVARLAGRIEDMDPNPSTSHQAHHKILPDENTDEKPTLLNNAGLLKAEIIRVEQLALDGKISAKKAKKQITTLKHRLHALEEQEEQYAVKLASQ